MQINLFSKICRQKTQRDQKNTRWGQKETDTSLSASHKQKNQEMDFQQFQRQLSSIGFPLVEVQDQSLQPKSLQNVAINVRVKTQSRQQKDVEKSSKNPFAMSSLVKPSKNSKQTYQCKNEVKQSNNSNDAKYQTLQKNLLKLRKENQELKIKNAQAMRQNQSLRKNQAQLMQREKQILKKVQILQRSKQEMTNRFQKTISLFVNQIDSIQIELKMISKENEKYIKKVDSPKIRREPLDVQPRPKRQPIDLKQLKSPYSNYINYEVQRRAKFNSSFSQKPTKDLLLATLSPKSNQIIETKIDRLHEQISKQISLLKNNF